MKRNRLTSATACSAQCGPRMAAFGIEYLLRWID